MMFRLACAALAAALGCSRPAVEDLPVVYDLAGRLEHAIVTGGELDRTEGGWSQRGDSRVAWHLVVPRRAALRLEASLAEDVRAEATLVAGDERLLLASLDSAANRVAVPLAGRGGRRVTIELAASGPVRWQNATVTGIVEPRDVNLLLFTIDTLRADHVGAYGYARATTPHIDALAARGTTFLHAFSTSNQSGPSHASLFTGRYPQSHGLVTNYQQIDPQQRTLADYLGRAGLQTSAHTNFAILGDRTRAARGFAHRRVVPGTPRGADLDDRLRNVFAYARAWLEASWRERFFLWIHSQYLHLADVPEPFVSMFLPEGWKPGADGVRIAGLPKHEVRHVMSQVNEGKLALSPAGLESVVAAYDGAIRMTDELLGLTVRELVRHGLDPFTAIVVTSDHGMSLGEFGILTHLGRPHDHQLHVPLILVLPGATAVPGRKLAGLVEQIDVAPTLLSYFGSTIPRRMQGIDLMPAIRGGELAGKDYVFAWVGSSPEKTWQTVRDRRWRYQERNDREPQWVDVAREGPEDARVAATPPAEGPALLAALERWMRDTPIVHRPGRAKISPEMRKTLEEAGYAEVER